MMGSYKESPILRKYEPLWIVILLALTKIISFVYLFNLEFKKPYGKLELSGWWLIFHRWDSAYYDRIASKGYVDLAHWAFLPGFTSVVRLIYLLVGHSGVATALAGIIFGLV